jgi:hypothetical protein
MASRGVGGAQAEGPPNLAKERTDSDALAVLVLADEHESPSP